MEGGFGIENGGVVDSFSAPGFGASHTAHFSVADAEFIKPQVAQVQPPPFIVGGFSPAALQLNPPELELVKGSVGAVAELAPNMNGVAGDFGIDKEGGTGLEAPGLGASHAAHPFTEGTFIKSQTPHFHPFSRFGGFKPAAPQSNPPFVAEMATVEFEVGGGEVPVPVPALSRVDGPAEDGVRFHASSIVGSSSRNPLTSFSAFNSPELLPSLIVLLGRTNASGGRSEIAIERTSALASLGGTVAVGDTEEAEEFVSSLSALILNRNFDGSLGADDLRPKKDLPEVVGETVGVDGEAPLRPAVCN